MKELLDIDENVITAYKEHMESVIFNEKDKFLEFYDKFNLNINDYKKLNEERKLSIVWHTGLW